MKKPLFIINAKSYEQAMGNHALQLCELLEAHADQVRPVFIPNILDVAMVSEQYSGSTEIWAPYADAVEYGPHTGHVPLERLQDLGIKGIMIGHSEQELGRQLELEIISGAKERGLEVMAVVRSIEKAELVFQRGADHIAFEPRSLIGGDVSVVDIMTEEISEYVSKYGQRVLVGAGISSSKDFSGVCALGAGGILVASHVVKAENQKGAIMELMS